MDCWIRRLGAEAPREGTRRAGRQKAEMREGRVWLVFGGWERCLGGSGWFHCGGEIRVWVRFVIFGVENGCGTMGASDEGTTRSPELKSEMQAVGHKEHKGRKEPGPETAIGTAKTVDGHQCEPGQMGTGVLNHEGTEGPSHQSKSVVPSSRSAWFSQSRGEYGKGCGTARVSEKHERRFLSDCLFLRNKSKQSLRPTDQPLITLAVSK